MLCKRNQGFSLVELAVVLVVAGLVLAIGAPSLVTYLNSKRVSDAARVLSNEMRVARQKAVTNGTRNWVYTQWGTGANQYWTGIQTSNGTGGWNATVWTGPIDLPARTKQIQANFSSYTSFAFEPNGRPIDASVAAGRTSGLVKVISTMPSVTDTITVNLDLSGSVW